MKRLKGGKGEFDLQLDFWQKKYLISEDVLNPESEGSAQSHNNRYQKNVILKCSYFLNEKPQRVHTHLKMTPRARATHLKHPAVFTLQKADKGDLRRLEHPPLK